MAISSYQILVPPLLLSVLQNWVGQATGDNFFCFSFINIQIAKGNIVKEGSADHPVGYGVHTQASIHTG